MSNDAHAPLAVVTGSSSGIGLAIAQHLLTAGWRVVGADVATPVLRHDAFLPMEVDLSSDAQCQALAGGLAGTPDALVHAAGILRPGHLGALSAADGMRMWQLHVQAAASLANALAPGMVRRGSGRIVFLGSRVAHGMPGRGQYAASKAALVALARSWAAEVAAQGVTVNVVSPGATDTAMLSRPERAASAPRLPPIGRLIQPAEIAALVTFLLSAQAAAITGQNITICGGASLAF